ncbi:MAG: glycosyltransferase family 2 protein [Deltaproteobacteria bacterium]|nr:glycosyltransferase family 2 protein [Deltaproteobacteria bacterium]MBW2075266.1 glycosyltransferase family 2 protein [Deltaproteobacteria bacterium]RLB81597.1 MAG: hypothetical protein DRH17_08640 [Deltaproteobacteria bacterium]
MLNISLIIPTYKRSRDLLRALNSLQDGRFADFEVIVVDNAAQNDLQKMVKAFNRTARIRAEYIPEPRLGLHNARHAGAHAAKGDILVFTDDDATFDPGWLQSYAKAFTEYPEMAAAGGPVRPIWEVPPPKWLLDFIGEAKAFGHLSLMEPYYEFRLEPKGVFYGVNMAIRRDILFDVGGFNPESFGDVWLGDGETGLNRKLWDRGMLIGYVPGALVYHHIPASRMSVQYLCHRMANEGACTEYARFHRRIPGPFGLFSRLVRIKFALMIRPGMMSLARMIRHDRFTALKARTELSYNLARLRYLIRLFHDKNFRELVVKKDWLEPLEGVYPNEGKSVRRFMNTKIE